MVRGRVELIVSAIAIARASCTDVVGCGIHAGFSILCWTIGDLALTTESLGGQPTDPSLATFLSVFYPLAYVGIVMFMRGRSGD